ncbi:hypothetical protein [Pseudanabaena sp. ABRG5-3]|uniref:hypothetical protein n=1 Tax=Pseudanabaena sp. ABRG5-3 TaxID=685565 RepID=UPI000DC6F3E6|nr:hypothetical protein [Pseudanabaena sp. ABRG5-3]BBC23737.1 hypothetical protein ABRG53_1480 [Pseudanabaena sp. ABRG5-3]
MLSITLRRVLVASGLAVTTSFMTALSASAAPTTANATAGFTGTIDPSCAVQTDFTNNAANKLAYTADAYTGSGSGGVLKLSANQSAVFNCNSVSVGVSTDVTLTQPTAAATPGALLVGIHKTTITGANNVANTANATGSGTALVTGTAWDTDNQGNISINVASEWNPQSGGQELLNGIYTAVATVTVTPN